MEKQFHWSATRIITQAAKYVKIVEWSDEDGAFDGQCPGIVGLCCHGPDETEVYNAGANHPIPFS